MGLETERIAAAFRQLSRLSYHRAYTLPATSRTRVGVMFLVMIIAHSGVKNAWVL